MQKVYSECDKEILWEAAQCPSGAKIRCPLGKGEDT